uniref:Uncharacterized protein n=1 Tax=Glossina brevipalpis TaxID=37001 RepID=A0A1A9W2H2_9MUSC
MIVTYRKKNSIVNHTTTNSSILNNIYKASFSYSSIVEKTLKARQFLQIFHVLTPLYDMKLLVVLVVSPGNCILCSETFCTEHHGANRDCSLLAFPKVTFAAQLSDLMNDDNDAYISCNRRAREQFDNKKLLAFRIGIGIEKFSGKLGEENRKISKKFQKFMKLRHATPARNG